MTSAREVSPEKRGSICALEATNFFLADVQTGVGPFLAAYLAGAGWDPGRVGMALTVGGMITVVLQAPAGAIVDALRSKRLILVLASAVLAVGALLLSVTAAPWAVYTSQALIGGAGPFLAPTLAAVTMGIDVPEPPSFTVSDEQLRWAETELKGATATGQSTVVLLHCYPSDLKVGGEELSRLVREYGVTLIDMGHTHYNEIANDGRTLYSATRSTGQIEEGPVGYSVTNLDGAVVSWRFIELGKLPVAVITSPSDERLLTRSSEMPQGVLKVRAKFWGEVEALEASAELGGQKSAMKRVRNSHVWEAELKAESAGVHPLKVSFKDARGKEARDEIRLAVGQRVERKSEERDQDNALEAWPEHGLLGTQLGPNKNGKKW